MHDSAPRPFTPFAQSAEYGQAVAACGAQVFVADLIFGQALVVQRGRMRLISRGPIWDEAADDHARRAALRRFARWPGLTVVTPENVLSGFGLVPLVTPMHHAVWPLSGDMRAALAGKWRNRLTSAEKAGIRATRGGRGALDRLTEAELAQRSERCYRALPPAFTQHLPAEALRVWQWHHGGRMQAAMAFVRHGTSATYHLGWADEAARRAGAHGIMLWTAANALRDEGVDWLDLGAVNTEEAPGLARFKLGTGCQLRQLGATCLIVPA